MVRRNGQVRGPFTYSILEKLAKLGRLEQTDELSTDNKEWKSAGDFSAFFVEVETERLLKDDERSGWDRREEDDSTTTQKKRQ